MLDITLLGSGGGMPMPKRHLSSMIISYKGRKILIDCGEGTQVAMRRWHTGFRSIDIILITHLHGDHIFGLPGLLSTLGNSERKEPITIIGPPGLTNMIGNILNLVGYLPFDIKIIEDNIFEFGLSIDSEILQIGNKIDDNMYIATMNLEHSSPCLGYKLYIPRQPKFNPQKAIENKIPVKYWSRLQNGEDIEYNGRVFNPSMVLGEERKGIKLSYITDTRPIIEIIDFIRDSDLFVCEGTYGDSNDVDKAIKNTHMTFKEASNLAKEANVQKLLLTHFSPSIDDPSFYKEEATDIFENTIIGYDGYKESLYFQ